MAGVVQVEAFAPRFGGDQHPCGPCVESSDSLGLGFERQGSVDQLWRANVGKARRDRRCKIGLRGAILGEDQQGFLAIQQSCGDV
jgi:hypothetical protein